MHKNTEGAPYRAIILEHFQRRQRINRSYSLRAFARDLSLSPASLSLILSGRQGLSAKNAEIISNKLNLDESEKDFFLNSVLELHSRSSLEKSVAKRKMALVKAKFNKENESILEDWLNIPILEYLRANLGATEQQLAKAFDISVIQASTKLKHLEQKKILKRTKKKWEVKHDYLSFGDEASSQMIKNFHKESLKQAATAIEIQGLNERLVSSTFFNIDLKRKDDAFESLKKFRREFCVEYSEDNPKTENEVYCLAIQFFKTHRS